MALNLNIMSTAPNQPATTPRTTSQGAQPRYKPATRAGRKNFGATLDKVHAKLDELKQSIKGLQDTQQEAAQVEGDEKILETEAENQSAQGTSDTPQDAPQQDEKNLSAGEKVDEKISSNDKPKDTKSLPEEEEPPAEISFAAEKILPVNEKISVEPSEKILPFARDAHLTVRQNKDLIYRTGDKGFRQSARHQLYTRACDFYWQRRNSSKRISSNQFPSARACCNNQSSFEYFFPEPRAKNYKPMRRDWLKFLSN